MSKSNIKYREYHGITVGDVNDIIEYVNGMSSSPIGSYVVNVGKQGDVYYALNSSGEQITWTQGGGGETPLDYVVNLRSSGYSIDYGYYEKGVFGNASIYFATINGESVIGKYDIDIPVVTANPSTQPQATLSKIKIDDITYSVEGGGGTSDYNDLTNKPSINKLTLQGDKTSDDLNLVDKTNDQTIGGIKTFNGFQTRFQGLTNFSGTTNLFQNGIYAGGSTIESTEYKVDRINVLGVDEYGEHIKRTLMLPFKNDTIATLDDIQATEYTGSTNIEIDDENVIKAKNLVTTNTVQSITGNKSFGGMVLGQDGRINYGSELPYEYFVKWGDPTQHTLVKIDLPRNKAEGTYTLATTDEFIPKFLHTIKITNIPAQSPYSTNAVMSIVVLNNSNNKITDATRLLANLGHIMSGSIVDDKKIGTLHVAGADQLTGLPFYDGTSIVNYDISDFTGATFQDNLVG